MEADEVDPLLDEFLLVDLPASVWSGDLPMDRLRVAPAKSCR
jgi:hypothetical protein